MKAAHRVLIIADIEGSSGCNDYRASQWFNRKWIEACGEMTQDVLAVVGELLKMGVREISVVDFHRTGFNLFRDEFPQTVYLCQGYRQGPVPGIGVPPPSDVLIMLGMHSPSGTPGFLPHTLTSSFSRLEINGNPLSEGELFSTALAPFGLKPVFFSGCEVACKHLRKAIPGIETVPVPKKPIPDESRKSWRKLLAQKAAESIDLPLSPFIPSGPFSVFLKIKGGMEDGQALEKMWGIPFRNGETTFSRGSLFEVYEVLIRFAYLTPITEKFLPISLRLFNLLGRNGLTMARNLFS